MHCELPYQFLIILNVLSCSVTKQCMCAYLVKVFFLYFYMYTHLDTHLGNRCRISFHSLFLVIFFVRCVLKIEFFISLFGLKQITIGNYSVFHFIFLMLEP